MKNEPEIVVFALTAIYLHLDENLNEAKNYFVKMCDSVKSNPQQLKDVSDFESVGEAIILMLNSQYPNDIDALHMMSSIGYYFITKAIEKNPSEINLFKNRLLLLRHGNDYLKYTVISALNLNSGGVLDFGFQLAPSRARNAIYQMEIADFESDISLFHNVDFFHERILELESMINRGFFLPNKTKESVIKTGEENHSILYEYLEGKLIIDGNVDF